MSKPNSIDLIKKKAKKKAHDVYMPPEENKNISVNPNEEKNEKNITNDNQNINQSTNQNNSINENVSAIIINNDSVSENASTNNSNFDSESNLENKINRYKEIANASKKKLTHDQMFLQQNVYIDRNLVKAIGEIIKKKGKKKQDIYNEALKMYLDIMYDVKVKLLSEQGK